MLKEIEYDVMKKNLINAVIINNEASKEWDYKTANKNARLLSKSLKKMKHTKT